MSGHSKWSQIKRKKGVEDVKRAKVFTKMAQVIALAAREGGSDASSNAKLRLAIEKARTVNMPASNIERAIDRGAGKSSGAQLQEILLEGYGPGGSALIIEAITDNKNRTIPEIRRVLETGGGKMANEGSVLWMFEKVGKVFIDPENKNREDLELQAIEAGADDVFDFEDEILAITNPQNTELLKKNISDFNVKTKSSSLGFVPKNLATINKEDLSKNETLVEKLEDMDDVQEVTTNMSVVDYEILRN
ncbi:MAG: transcriptional regulator [Parcubacteria group bacterium GW2011_GWA2_39_18]|nr:MAG: transcriptional regulator [Parcubacteria group bacterium GW2011_GWA2_39_18]